MYLNVDHTNLPIPLAIALAAIGAGGGGAGAWLLAARGLAHHPGVQHVAQHVAQQAMYAGAHSATVAAEGLSQIGQGPATYLFIGAAAATIFGGLLLAVCVCAGGTAGAAAWYLGHQPLPAPTRAPEAATLADLAELAAQVLLGGQAAQDTVARRLHVAP